MIRKKPRLLIRTFLIHFLNHRTGQLLVRAGRRAPKNFWSRTRPFRIYLLAIPKIHNQKPDSNHILVGSQENKGLPKFLTQGPKDRKVEILDTQKKVIRILGPFSKNGHHNIMNLGRFFGDNLSKSCPATLLLTPTLETRKSGNCLEGLYDKRSDNYLNISSLSIYHIGNNPNSAILLEDFFENIGQKIVVMHDLWLFDLYQHLGTRLGRNSMGFDMCQSSLGVYGTKGLSEALAGKILEDQQRLEIGKVFLDPIMSAADKVIFHNRDNIYAKWILDEHACKAIHVNLPLGYPADTNPKSTIFVGIDTVLVSGKISEKYDVLFYQELIFVLLQHSELKKIVIFGDVVNLLDARKLKKMSSAKKISIKPLSLVSEFTESEWTYFLGPNSLGIRLGVGFNGESSGIVRDFLNAGMSVITNEKIENLSSYSKYFHVSDDVDASQITNSVQSALIRTEKLTAVDELNDYRLASLADYKDVLTVIKRDFYNGH